MSENEKYKKEKKVTHEDPEASLHALLLSSYLSLFSPGLKLLAEILLRN